MPRDVVYTVLIQGYDPIRPQPIADVSDADFLCFTDNVDIEAHGWKLVKVEPMLEADPVRSQRMLKILGHEALEEYDRTLYIDNTVELRRDPSELLDTLLAESDFGLFEHSFRDRLIDEFDEVVRLNYDDAPRVHEQLWAYAQCAPDALEGKPLWTAILARRRSALVEEFEQVWSREVLRYSRRDQLSVGYAVERTRLPLTRLVADNFESEWHLWSTSPARRVAQGKSSAMPSGPLLAEARRSQSAATAALGEQIRLQDRISDLEGELRRCEDTLTQTQQHLSDCEERTQLIRSQVAEASSKRDVLQIALHDMVDSTSWKVTAPVRAFGSAVRRLRGRG